MRAADFIEGGSGEMPQPDAELLPMPPPEAAEPPRTPRSVWLVGALGAGLLHAGCVALAYGYLQSEGESDELGAPAIEVAVTLEAPPHDAANLPPGPDAEESTASPEVAEQKTEVEQTDLPKATPIETEDPDRVVAPQETKKPVDDAPKTPIVQTAPSNASVAAVATAIPSPETAVEGPRSTAPELGTGDSLRRDHAKWVTELNFHLKKNLRYPAGRPPQHIDVIVRIVLDRTGHVVSAEVVKSAGDAAFDNAALAMIKRADPVPAPPPGEVLTYTLPVAFGVKGK